MNECMHTSFSFGQEEAQAGPSSSQCLQKCSTCWECRVVPRKSWARGLGDKEGKWEPSKPRPRRGALTCAHVDSEGYDHGGCHHPTPGLHLRLPHAVEDGYTAHVALSG